MKCRSKLTLIAASFMLAASAQALEAKLSKADLPLLAPEVQHTTASKRVTSRLTRSHYKHFNLNDEFSQAMFDRYVEMLDYNKNIFTQSDINSFAEWSVQLDDQLKSGSNMIAFKLYNLANEKRFERLSCFNCVMARSTAALSGTSMNRICVAAICSVWMRCRAFLGSGRSRD